MKLLALHLTAFGPFSARVLAFGGDDGRARELVLVHGPNEAGKSSALRAITDLRFGIPQQSRDNFVHAHPEMRIGGEFIDADGARHALLRRKGRGATLLLARRDDESGRLVETPEPAGARLEASLTGNLAREAYESMFGLDHKRLRQGGEALLNGDGDVGAALFEASAGVRSAPQVLDRLDATARRFFIPGGRGRNGAINIALKSYDESHAELRQHQLRPAAWAQLARSRDEAASQLAALEQKSAQLGAWLALIGELRGVAPQLRAFDQASQQLEELIDAPLLAESAPAERAAAESGLIDAQYNAAEAAGAVAQQQQRLDALAPDERALAVAGAVQQLGGASESIQSQQREIELARVEVALECRRVRELATTIDGALDADAVVAKAPRRTERALIEELLGKVLHAEQAAHQHADEESRELAAAPAADASAEPQLPDAATRAALADMRAELAQRDAELKRLAALPLEIDIARRALDAALLDLGVADACALGAMRELLDAQIDAALAERNRIATRIDEAETRIDRVERALTDKTIERERLLRDGAVATRDEVDAARARRDARWRRLRAHWPGARGEKSAAGDADDDDGARHALPLLDAFEDAVALADRLIDRFASDSARATELQMLARESDLLEHERGQQQLLLDRLRDDAARQSAQWHATLAAAALPELAPEALREWLGRLRRARQAHDDWRARRDEQRRLGTLELALRRGLHAALVAVGGLPSHPLPVTRTIAGDCATRRFDATPTAARQRNRDEAARAAANPTATHAAVGDEEAAADAAAPPPLHALVATALATAHELDRREAALREAGGAARERERRLARHRQRGAELTAALDDAWSALRPRFAALLLARDASAAVLRARLDEFEELAQARAGLAAAEAKLKQATRALAGLGASISGVAALLGDSEPSDARGYFAQVQQRLERALQVQRQRELAQNALAEATDARARHEATAARHRQTLALLCRAARVAAPEQLAQAEENSRRKREAQRSVDRLREQIAQSSQRGLAELRELLAESDAERINADEQQLKAEQAQLAIALRAARERDEAARRALDAVDGADVAAAARERMEQAAASVRANMAPWLRSRLAHALLTEALQRFRERAQDPMLAAASRYFECMTAGEFVRLLGDDAPGDGRGAPVLVAERARGARIAVDAMSEGTRDQLYLALRLAALEIRRASGVDLPLVLDDVLMTSDEQRSGAALEALARFAQGGQQVIVFTHHRHVADVAARRIAPGLLALVAL